MKKIIYIFLIFSLTVLTGYSADLRFIQVDGVLYNQNNLHSFETLIEKINQEKDVEFIVFTGNNISKPNSKELENFLLLAKKLTRPYYIVLGQRDVNRNKNLSKKDYMGLVQKKVRAHKKITSPNYVFKKKNLVFIALDGSKEVIPTSIGYYKDDVILWLDEKLDMYKNNNVIILQHYPIVPPAPKETHYTYKADEYLKLLSEHNNVKAVVAGHFNTNNEQEVNGILHISTKNAPCYRIIDVLDYDTSNPTFWSILKE